MYDPADVHRHVVPEGAHYAASKAGEMLEAVAPTAEGRERLRAQLPLGRFGRADEVARGVRFLVAEAPDYLTGRRRP